MKKPFLMLVDDDAAVLKAVERDVRGRFGGGYKVLTADSGETALALVRQLTARGDQVALFLVDQRMPQMSGVEFLEQAIKLQPDASRVLLTAYADSNAAINAINKVRLNHYLLKPWEPPEQHLYPVLTDLLEDWRAGQRPAFEGVIVVGTRWSSATHAVKDFLAKSQVPYHWTEPGPDTQDPRIVSAFGASLPPLPAVIFPDGAWLSQPSSDALADKLGLRTRPQRTFYDVIVVGAGPAGLAAALYTSTEGLRTVVVEREAPGGQAGLSTRIENYLGFPSGLSGADLARRGMAQIKRFGTELLAPERAVKLRAEGEYRVVTLDSGQELAGHTVVLACGVQWRRLAIPGMDRLTGAGVYYGAAITEAASCKDEDVYVVGGANSAGQASVHFAEYARRVTMLVRGGSLAKSMSHYLVERIQEIPNISVETGVDVVAVHGDDRLTGISLQRDGAPAEEYRSAGSLFIFIGAEPHTEWLQGVLDRDERGFLITGRKPKQWPLDRNPFLLETCMPGVFAVGDVRQGAVRRVANSVGEGSIVVFFIRQYLANR
jgi:thioredoxin reductase (NADPH)